MASTVADDGAEKCYLCDICTTKRFACVRGHKVWMCGNCHRDRPVCSLCSAQEEEYKTDTDLDSRPDSSFSPEEPFAELHEKVSRGFAELHEKMVRGDYDEVLSEVKRYKAYLQLVEGKACHAMAGITSENEKRDALRRAQDAARKSQNLLFSMPLVPDMQEKSVIQTHMHLEAKLLQFNTAVSLGELPANVGARFDAMLKTARGEAKEAAAPQLAALSVERQIEEGRAHFGQLNKMMKFLEARPGAQEGTTERCAAAFWNMYIVKKEAGCLQEAVAWVKQATPLHERMLQRSRIMPDPYTGRYHDCLVKLQKSINTHKKKLEQMDWSDNQLNTFARALADIDLGALCRAEECRCPLQGGRRRLHSRHGSWQQSRFFISGSKVLLSWARKDLKKLNMLRRSV